MALAVRRHKQTYEEYKKLPDKPRMELIDGAFVMSPAPSFQHQSILGKLLVRLTTWVEKHRLGTVVCAPVDVVLSETDVVQPDVLFIAKKSEAIIRRAVHGPPDLVIEILSPHFKKRDTVEKKHLYEQYGVKEYWIVDPFAQTILQFLHDGKSFAGKRIYHASQILESTVIPGYKLTLHEILDVPKS